MRRNVAIKLQINTLFGYLLCPNFLFIFYALYLMIFKSFYVYGYFTYMNVDTPMAIGSFKTGVTDDCELPY